MSREHENSEANHKVSISKENMYKYSKNLKTSTTKSTSNKGLQEPVNSRTTEGILKAARLGDLKMLTELHREGIFFIFLVMLFNMEQSVPNYRLLLGHNFNLLRTYELCKYPTGYSLLSIDETGKSALHYGARFGHKEIVKFLIGNAPTSILDMVDNEKGM